MRAQTARGARPRYLGVREAPLLPLLSRCDMLLIILVCLVAVGIVLIFARVPIARMMAEVMSEKTLEDMVTILDRFALGAAR